jgi:hypothetical protein
VCLGHSSKRLNVPTRARLRSGRLASIPNNKSDQRLESVYVLKERDVFATALRRQRRSVPQVLLCMLLATACDETGSVQSPMPSAPTPLPESSRYRVSGIVMDAADAAPIANATVVLRHALGHLTAQTGGDGAYAFSFETSQPHAPRIQNVPADILGLLVVRDGSY